ncbi:hypothetical protein JCM8097_004712 [Rhodosporidiobolus ruineniae]
MAAVSVDGADKTSAAPKGGDAADSARIGWAFLSQYYSFLNKDPARLHCFYTKRSTLIHSTEGEDTSACYGQQEIHTKIMSLGFDDCKVYISNVDSQSSAEGGIIVQVIGEMSNANGSWRKFAQTFFLAEQPNGYFVLNDICRYLKEEGDDVEGNAAPAPASPTEAQPVSTDAVPASVQSVLFDSNHVDPAVEAPVAAAVAAEEPASADATTDSFTFHGDNSFNPAPVENGVSHAEEPAVAAEEPAAVEPIATSTPPEPEAAAPVEQPKEEEEVAAPAPAVVEETPAPVKEETPAPAAPVADLAPPVPVAAPAPAAATPAAPAASPVPSGPKTWASLAATNSGGWAQIAAQKKGVSAAAPPPAAAPAPAASTSTAPAAPQPAFHETVQAVNTTACFVKGVVETVSDKALRDTLTTRFGALKEVDIVRSKACAFIEFEKLNDARKAIQASLRPSDGGDGGIHIDVGLSQPARINVVERKPHSERPGGNAGRGGKGGEGASRGGRGGSVGGRGGRGGRGGAKAGAAQAAK